MNLSTRFILLGLCLILLAVPLTLFAQDLELTETFVSSDGEVTFNYPDGWDIEEDENDIYLFGDEDSGELFIAFFKPSTISNLGDSVDGVFEALVAAFELDVTADDFVNFKIGNREAMRVDFPNVDDNTENTLIAIDIGGGEVGVIYAIVNAGETEKSEAPMLAILETFAPGDGIATVTSPVEAEALTAHASDDPEDTIAELVELGLVSKGGSLVFQEDRAFFTGRGNWFTPLARRSPNTHIVMAGTLSFTIGDANEFEGCTLTARIGTNNTGNAITFVDVGFTNEGSIYILDLYEQGTPANIEDGAVTYDLSEPHHVLFILLNNQANIYVDGELAISNFEVAERSGTYGIALVGKGANARCEGENIWVYRVPSANPEVCTVSSASAVNKRSGPGTNFDAAGQLPAGQPQTVIGQAVGANGQTWWQLEDETWVREDVVTEEGDCADVATV